MAAVYRGERALAVDHYRQAVRIARRAGSAHWTQRAARAAGRLGDVDHVPLP
jgi:hypothetical protein